MKKSWVLIPVTKVNSSWQKLTCVGAVGRSGLGVILPCGFIRGEIQSFLEVTGSDFSLVNLRGRDFILNLLYTNNVTRENPGNLSRQARPKTVVLGVYGGKGGPLGDALIVSAQDE